MPLILSINMILIIFAGLFFMFGWRLWNVETFSLSMIYSLVLIIFVYITTWISLALLHKNKYLKNITKKGVWIAMIPNGAVGLVLIILGSLSHLGFIHFLLAQMVFISVIIVPFLFFFIAGKKNFYEG